MTEIAAPTMEPAAAVQGYARSVLRDVVATLPSQLANIQAKLYPRGSLLQAIEAVETCCSGGSDAR